MNTVDIDCSILNDVITDSYQSHRNDKEIVSHIMTDMVENGYVDETWGTLMYDDDGNYTEDGVEIDAAILNKLEQYITELVKTLN